MINSVLILVPHQDDELNIAGSLLDQMVSANIRITVCFMTNGDYRGEQEERLKEVKKVAAIFGYKDIIYLGYGDGGFENSLYDVSDDNTILVSPAGKKETYGVGDIKDFHYQQYGKHSLYTKRNLREDIKDVICYVKADIIFCIDKDEHPDHKLLSEQFDLAIKEILLETDYRPLILKKFAYLGVFYGENDYFSRPMQATKCASYGIRGRMNCEPYEWEQRISFAVNANLYPLLFWRSSLFKALKLYKTQRGVAHFPKICNADANYWFYDTTNSDYKVSKTFPIKETPFRFFLEKKYHTTNHFFLKSIFAVYLLFAYRIPGKIRRMMKNGI